ncbi:MAG: N-acetylmuramoyl-L-alanine amidase [Rhizobiales bacterium]|nr:N-acetylmuramoyl-L-alanine amidase [Hyphomicrobiales bacterium]
MQPDSALVAECVPSPNHGERRHGGGPDILLLHYTGMPDTLAALRRLCSADAEVSAHYLVFEDGRIVQCVPEARRAWHAGASRWRDIDDVNSHSIGVEIANPGHEHGYRDFPSVQIDAVTALARDILDRHPIRARDVLAHSDVAPARKDDPGEKFPWRHLYENGVGQWVEPAALDTPGETIGPGSTAQAVAALQQDLRRYGYGIDPTGIFDEQTVQVVRAFQRHFRPARIDAAADPSTRLTLRRLLDLSAIRT